MRGKGCESRAANSSSTYVPHLPPISFKNSNSKSTPKLISANPNPNPNYGNLQQLPNFTHRRHWHILSTTVFSLSSATASGNPCLYAAGDDDKKKLLHPLTLKPHPSNRPINVDLLNRRSTSLAFFYHTTDYPFEKLVIPLPRAATIDGDAMVVLYGGGKLLRRLPLVPGQNWVALSEDMFDDIIATTDCTYVVDRLGRLFVTNSITLSMNLSLGRAVISRHIPHGAFFYGWRKRIVMYWEDFYLVVRVEEKVFRVYMLTRGIPYSWDEVGDFGGAVLFVSKGCCFFMDHFGRKEYENCIVFSESGFPKYGDDCWDSWEYNDDEDEIGVFRITDKRFGRVGESVDFPDIDWSPPSWIFDVREPDDDDGGVQSNANVEGDTALQKDVPASLFASISAVEEDVTRTLLLMNSGKEATEKESSRKNTTMLAPRACTSSSSAKGNNSNFATAKFEGFDVRLDLVPTLQKIWRNHGNIIEKRTIRSGDIIARALESLANMVQTLENTSVLSLSDFQAEYLSSTLCDLKLMGFKVHWLVSLAEKAVKLHRSKALVESLNKLTELSSQVQVRRDTLLDEVAKLNEKENKLKTEIAKVSNAIPFSGEVKLDEPLGSGLT